MNILIMPSWYEIDDDSSSGIFFTEQAKALKSMGNNVTLAIVDILNYPYKTHSRKYRIIKEIRHGIDVYRIIIPSLLTGHVPKLFFSYYLFYYKKLFKYMLSKGLKFDILYAHSFWHAGYIGTIIKEEYGIPLIIQEHRSMLITGEFSEKVNKYLTEAVLKSDVFYCVSNRLKESVSSRTGLKEGIEILPNMVDNIFHYQPLKNKKFTYTFIGTLNDNKRIIQLIKCFEVLIEKNKELSLKIAGDGPLREQIEAIVKGSNQLAENVDILGALTRKSIFELLTASNVLVLPSVYETFGIVCIEAMAVGRPVICTRNGSTDFINERNGILIDADSNTQLISAMERMYNSFDSYDLKGISEQCLQNYSSYAIMTKLTSKMNEIIKRSKAE